MFNLKKLTILTSISMLQFLSNAATNYHQSDKIRVNQIGYFPSQEKTAAVQVPLKTAYNNWGLGEEFQVINAETNEVAYKSKLNQVKYYPFSREAVRLADFSALKTPGKYFLKVGNNCSYKFEIKNNLYNELSKSVLKMFYYFRCSSDIKKEYGGKWHRPMGIPDDKVIIHKSAASPGRPAGTIVSAPGGWFDAGDYNKYTVNAGITTFSLLALYESYPKAMKKMTINIPETGNGVPDILNQVYWELKWLEKMQDPTDGSVYHKLSALTFSKKTVMPQNYHKKRYMIGKSTSAALNYAATLAQASRVFAPYEKQFPGFSKRILKKAKYAYEWALKHPSLRYDQTGSDCTTGIYQDENYSSTDEFSWAATELYITTKDDNYYKQSYIPGVPVRTPVWTHVSALPYISLINNMDNLTKIADKKQIKQRLTEYVDYKVFDAYKATGVAYRMANKRYEWGSNGFVANIGMLAIMAYKVTNDQKYLNLAISHMDYLLGKNPLNKSFITSFGSDSPQHIHQRLCMADGIKEPIPGIICGGPNPWEVIWDLGPLAYNSALPALSYADNDLSFSTNEAAINWNAPLVYLSGAIQAIVENK